MKRIIQISLFIIFAVALTGMMGFIYVEQGRQPLKEVAINIRHKGEKGFLNDEMVRKMIVDYDSLPQLKINQIKTSAIESELDKSPFIKMVDAYVNIDRNLIVNIEEKNAVLRIFNQKQPGFYIDESGNIFPLSDQYTPRVMIVNGYIDIKTEQSVLNIYDSIYAKTCLVDLFRLNSLISQDKFLKAQISEIYVNSKGEFDLIPQLGNHLIRFGTMEDAENKINKLDIFYRKALIGEGWDKYEIINLKYKNQVVCKRK